MADFLAPTSPILHLDMRNLRMSFALVVAVSACSDSTSIPLPLPGGETSARIVPSALEGRRTVREEFRDLSRQIPGFTGIFFDADGMLTISASRDLSPGEQERVLKWAVGYSASVRQGAAVRQKRSMFDYVALYDGFQKLIDRVGGDSSLVSARIDEKEGQIVLGVEDGGSHEGILAALAELSLPNSILRIEADEATRPDSTLRDQIRTLTAGVQIANPYPWMDHCTLGHIVWHKNEDGSPNLNIGWAFYSSHCTESRYSVNRKPTYGQPTLNSPVAQEWEEAPVYSCSGYGSCQDADVAVLAILNEIGFGVASVAISSQPYDTTTAPPFLGRRSTANTISGALTGERVTKVGRTTGETSGDISETCVDRQVLGESLWILCNQRAYYHAGSGDSGAPVFIKAEEPGHSSTPRVAGLHWGSNVTRGGWVTSTFSPVSQINSVFGGRYQWF
jgi:hypothetical protein